MTQLIRGQKQTKAKYITRDSKVPVDYLGQIAFGDYLINRIESCNNEITNQRMPKATKTEPE